MKGPGQTTFARFLSLLYAELRWFMRLRWVAGAAVILGAAARAIILGGLDGSVAIGAIGAGILAYNAALWLADRRWPGLHRRRRPLLIFAAVQIYLDLALLTILTVLTGGITSPLIGFYVFHMVFAGLLQTTSWAFATAIIAVGMLAAGLGLAGQWPAGRVEALLGAGWICTMLVTVYLTNRIAASLYRAQRAASRQNRRLRELTDRLAAQQEALVQHEKMAAMGRLAAGVAHEINNPVSNIDSVLQLMERNPDSPASGKLRSLREQTRRISSTVHQLTTFAHPDKGRRETVPVNSLVNGALDLLRFDRRLRDIDVDLQLSDGAGSARIAPQAVQQVLVNIVLNAIDATSDRPEPRLVIRTARHNDQCTIAVSDNGCGISEEHLQQIFDPFFTTKPAGQGTGLGLSISMSLMREQGGHLEVHSVKGEGTTFTMRLPAADGAPDERRPRAATAHAGRS